MTRSYVQPILTPWRDHDPDLRSIPAVAMGRRPLAGDLRLLARSLFEEGARRVALDPVVDLSGDADPASIVPAMIALRELTAWGLVIDWRVRFGVNHPVWRRLTYLYPPAEVFDHPASADALLRWREAFRPGLCAYRRGPGFLEVRDRRTSWLSRFTIDDPEYLAAVEPLLTGTSRAAIPSAVFDHYSREGLVGVAGEIAWWLPHRIRRWTSPAWMS